MFDLALVPCEDSELFNDYAELIGFDMGQAIRGRGDLTVVFQSLIDNLKSTRCKLAPVKTSRWFSWCQACYDQLSEWWAFRMLLTSEYPEEQVDADTKPWGKLRSESGGLKLALHCTGWSTWLSVCVLFLGGQPLWTWHSRLVEDVKTPQQGLARTISFTGGKWLGDKQLQDLIQVLWKSEHFAKMSRYLEISKQFLPPDSDCNMDRFVQELFFYILSLLEKRAASLSKMNLPPEVYASMLSTNQEDAQLTLDMLNSDWKALILVEQSPGNQALAKDLRLSVPPAVRLVYQLSELGNHESSMRLLKAMLLVLPDTKFIEDVHGKVRNDARANMNKGQTFAQIQQVIVGSRGFESRRIPHPAKLTKEAFKTRWKRTSGKCSFRSAFVAKSERLPEKYSRIFGAKKWDTVSEQSLHRSASAWELVRYYVKNNLRSKNVKLMDS